MKPTPPTVVAYTRVSTGEQATEVTLRPALLRQLRAHQMAEWTHPRRLRTLNTKVKLDKTIVPVK